MCQSWGFWLIFASPILCPIIIIGLKALGNYSDRLWSNKILVLLLARPKPPNSMISGFLSPGDPYLWICGYVAM